MCLSKVEASVLWDQVLCRLCRLCVLGRGVRNRRNSRFDEKRRIDVADQKPAITDDTFKAMSMKQKHAPRNIGSLPAEPLTSPPAEMTLGEKPRKGVPLLTKSPRSPLETPQGKNGQCSAVCAFLPPLSKTYPHGTIRDAAFNHTVSSETASLLLAEFFMPVIEVLNLTDPRQPPVSVSHLASPRSLCRAALDGGEYMKALKACKGLLAAEKDNYDALCIAGEACSHLLAAQLADVASGVAKEGGPDWMEQSEKAFIKASETEPLRIEAWKGLVELFDGQGMHIRTRGKPFREKRSFV